MNTNKKITLDVPFYTIARHRWTLWRKLSERYFELDKVRCELHRLWERMRMEWHQAESDQACRVTRKLFEQVEQEETRICRQMEKYSLWIARLDYWNIVYDNAYYRIHEWHE